MPGPLNSWMRTRCSLPSAPVNTSSPLPAPGTAISAFLYTSPYAWRPTMIGFFQPMTLGVMLEARIGLRKTVPSSAARMVPFGLFHCCLSEYSFTRSSFGVMVAHLTATPRRLFASAACIVTASSVSSRCSRPRS